MDTIVCDFSEISYRVLPGGPFNAGREAEIELPPPLVPHRAIVSTFGLSTTPVTRAQYARVMQQEFFACPEESCLPVVNLTWEKSVEFCRQLSQQAGLNVRLPREIEWEFAASCGGFWTKWSGTDEFDLLPEFAWWNRNSGGQLHPVAKKKPNRWGLFDMSGLVWEWCSDTYCAEGGDYENRSDGAEGVPSFRITRGGAYDEMCSTCQVFMRNYEAACDAMHNVGFRVAIEL